MRINNIHRKVPVRQFEGEKLLSALDWWYREFITVLVSFVHLDDLGLPPSLALAAFCLTLEMVIWH
jgi:hypothetical protein